MYIYKHITEDTSKRISEKTGVRVSQIHVLNDDDELFPDWENDEEIVMPAMLFIHNMLSAKSDIADIINDDRLVIINKSMHDMLGYIQSNHTSLNISQDNIAKLIVAMEQENPSGHKNRNNLLRFTYNSEIPQARKIFVGGFLKLIMDSDSSLLMKSLQAIISTREAAQSLVGQKFLVFCASREIENAQYFIDHNYSAGFEETKFSNKDDNTIAVKGGMEDRLFKLCQDRHSKSIFRSSSRPSFGKRVRGGIIVRIKIKHEILAGIMPGVSMRNIKYLPRDEVNIHPRIDYENETQPYNKAKIRLSYKFESGLNNQTGQECRWESEKETRLIFDRSVVSSAPLKPWVSTIFLGDLIDLENYTVKNSFQSDEIKIIEYNDIPELKWHGVSPRNGNLKPFYMAMGKNSGLAANIGYIHRMRVDRIKEDRRISTNSLPVDLQEFLLSIQDIDVNRTRFQRSGNSIQISSKNNFNRNGNIISNNFNFTVSKSECLSLIDAILKVEKNHSINYFSKLEVFKINNLIQKLLENRMFSRFHKPQEFSRDAAFWYDGVDFKDMLFIGRRSSSPFGYKFSCDDINPLDDTELAIGIEHLKILSSENTQAFLEECRFLCNTFYRNRFSKGMIRDYSAKQLIDLNADFYFYVYPFTDLDFYEINKNNPTHGHGGIDSKNLVHRFRESGGPGRYTAGTIEILMENGRVFIDEKHGITHLLTSEFHGSIVLREKGIHTQIKLLIDESIFFRQEFLSLLGEPRSNASHSSQFLAKKVLEKIDQMQAKMPKAISSIETYNEP